MAEIRAERYGCPFGAEPVRHRTPEPVAMSVPAVVGVADVRDADRKVCAESFEPLRVRPTTLHIG